MEADMHSQRLYRLTPANQKNQEPPEKLAFSVEEAMTAPTDQELQREWQNSPALRAEFLDNFDSYAAYRRADAAGRIRVMHAPVRQPATPGARNV